MNKTQEALVLILAEQRTLRNARTLRLLLEAQVLAERAVKRGLAK